MAKQLMSADELRQSYFEFFQDRGHSLVASASLLPQSPGLLFTNAGMNQFVPYFLGKETPPYDPPRAVDTQKCIRAGGKHNDLEDVGYDSYHHTMFEMLGNWSFGDYFKAEAIKWAWQLMVEEWGFPPERLYATVYRPGEGDPGSFDQEAYDLWAELYRGAGLDPGQQIVDGNVKDNFWMMGETGPCGPCSELHVDLTPNGDTKGALVNQDDERCIEIWNLVFIQFNAEADGTFRDLPARHVDTGMGFERACSIYQGTKGFTDFSKQPSNYATDVFTPLFRRLEELSGVEYVDIYPGAGAQSKRDLSVEMKQAIAFRVIADHLRTLAFSIADGILPGNNGRNYVLRRILRRAVRYGRDLGFDGQQPLLAKLVDTFVAQMGSVFPEVVERQGAIKEILKQEELSFNETLDRGLSLFKDEIAKLEGEVFAGETAFKLYDTFGFPLDLTKLLCEQEGLSLDVEEFEQCMAQQREMARAARTQDLVRAADIASDAVTEFVGFEKDRCTAKVLEIHQQIDGELIITDRTPFYAEMGGQLGDQGLLIHEGEEIEILGVQQLGNARAHIVAADSNVVVGDEVTLVIDAERRRPIERHHTATHLLHWCLREQVSKDISQQGSMVSRRRLRFDFNSKALRPEQLSRIEDELNAIIERGDQISASEFDYAEIKDRKDVTQFFGDKYGDRVRVVQVGGEPAKLNGYSMELCGGTHVSNTADLELFLIKGESAISSGVRRVEAVCAEQAWEFIREVTEKNIAEGKELRAKLKQANAELEKFGAKSVRYPEFPHIMESMLAAGQPSEVLHLFREMHEHMAGLRQTVLEVVKQAKKLAGNVAAKQADHLVATWLEGQSNEIVQSVEGEANLLQELFNGLKKRQFPGCAVLVVNDSSKAHIGVFVGEQAQASGKKAGTLLQQLAPLVAGRGGGKADIARGAGTELNGIEQLLSEAGKLLR